jgi:hypothetical protein
MVIMTEMFHELQGLVAGHYVFPLTQLFLQADQWSTALRPAVDQLSAAVWLLIRNMTPVRSVHSLT